MDLDIKFLNLERNVVKNLLTNVYIEYQEICQYNCFNMKVFCVQTWKYVSKVDGKLSYVEGVRQVYVSGRKETEEAGSFTEFID